jgi:hypothetical protein
MKASSGVWNYNEIQTRVEGAGNEPKTIEPF